ncbi:MAG: hypothetical protein HKN47_20005 [Pirellulaceae bacterium]|nr:hypothetical protein [Pirellulaceae bacterium]
MKFEGINKSIVGMVDEISPVVDAQSGTIKVKVRIDNPDGELLSGERCSIDIPVSGFPTREESAAVPNDAAHR